MTYHVSSFGQLDMSKVFPDSGTTTGGRTSSSSTVMSAQPTTTLVASPTRSAPSYSPLPPTGPVMSSPSAAAPGAPQLPAIPACLDATWMAALTYCDAYPAGGPDAGANAMCAVAKSNPSWYIQVKTTPPCQIATSTPPISTPPVDTATPATDKAAATGEPNYMLWGGIALLALIAGGGVYYYGKKKGAPA